MTCCGFHQITRWEKRMAEPHGREGRCRELLLNERSRILDFREGLGDSWRRLQEPDRELEERAQKENIVRGIDDLDTLEKGRIEEIDRALRKLETGSYGFCESCGEGIRDDRLQALPWARLCLNCAGGRKGTKGSSRKVKPGREDSVIGLTGVSCEEILEEIRQDGRVDTQELEVSCDGGGVLLEGYLPSEAEHAILFEILEDHMGIQEIIDEIAIKRTEKRGGTSPPPSLRMS